jgi:uncharacterized membrane protein YgcG
MKRTTILRAVCVAFLSAAMSAPMAQVGSASKGSIVAVKGVASNLRLPKAAGKVSKVGPTGTLVRSAPTTTFVAHGDKRVSLCYLNKAATVTCAPVANATTLAGIDVTYFQKQGYTLVAFRAATPSSKSASVTAPKVALAARAFMAGLNKAAVVLEHHAARHIGDLPMPSVVDAGGSCGYDDEGGMSCSGGGGGGGEGGGGESGGGGDPVPTGGTACWGCDYPADPVPPPDEGTTPATNANQPCTESEGTTVCVMTGPRLPMPIPIPPPGGGMPPPIGGIPPVGGIPPIEQLPSGSSSPWWLPTIDWCQLIGVGCPPVIPMEMYGSPAWYAEAVAGCKKEANAKYDTCRAMAIFRPSGYDECMKNADNSYQACLQEAEDATRRYRP